MTRKMARMDWRAMKYYQIRALLILVFPAAIGLFTILLMVVPTCVLLFTFFSINPFAVEEKGALNNLYLTLPVSRNAIVMGRYLLAGTMVLCGVVIGTPMMILINAVGWTHYYLPLNEYVVIYAFSYLMFALMNLCVYPILFKLGYAKGKIWGLVLPAVFMGILYGIFYGLTYHGDGTLPLNILMYAGRHLLAVSGGMTLLATGLLALSIALSRHIYAKRDF